VKAAGEVEEGGISIWIQVELSSRNQIIEAFIPRERGMKENFSMWGIAWGPTFFRQKSRG
jgi:hypothetical protein